MALSTGQLGCHKEILGRKVYQSWEVTRWGGVRDDTQEQELGGPGGCQRLTGGPGAPLSEDGITGKGERS